MAARFPGLKAVYVSGCLDAVILVHGALEEGASLPQRPFSVRALTSEIRDVLDS